MRRINFFDGAESETTPVIGNLVASNLVQYDSDASYEATEQGAPTTGNIYYNTTLNLIRYYNGVGWISLVDESSTQTVTGKLLDADNNTITNIENDNIKAGAAIDATKLADGSVSNTEFQYINTLTSNAQDQLDAKQDVSEKGQPNGYASLDGSGKIPSAQIPPVAITDVSVVADNAARDALVVEEGDIAYTADSGKWWLYDGSTWLELTTPATVNSVNGQTGTVVLDTDDISEGATNKYANGSIDTHSDVDVTTTPPNDGDILAYNNISGNWEPFASGGGSGTGSKNYFSPENGLFEVGTSGYGDWETDDGVGGLANFITRNSVTDTNKVLEGTRSLVISKSANNAIGEFAKVQLNPIDRGDLGKPLFGSFTYDCTDFVNGNYQNGDIIVEIYDLTNESVLYSGLTEDLELTATKGVFNFVVYPEVDTEDIEFRLKVNSTNASAWECYFDEFKLGPAAQVQGVYRNSITLSMNGSGDFTGGVVKVDRVGNNVTVTTTTAPTHASLTAAYSAAGFIPSWARPESNQTNMTNNGSSLMWTTYMGTDGQFGVAYRNYSGTLTVSTGTGVLSISYPVSDIAQPTVTENELSLQTIRVTSQVSTANHTNSGNYQDVSFTEDRDTHGAFNGTTFTAPRSGFYTFYAHVQFGSNATGRRGVQVVLTLADDASIPGNLLPASTTGAFGIMATGTVYMQKGGTAKVQGFQDSGGNLSYGNGVFSVVGNPDYTTLGVVKSEPVYVEARGSDGDALTADVTNIEWTEVTDTHGAWLDNQFTAPKTAYYMLAGVVRFQAAEGPPDLYIDGVLNSSLGGNSAGTQESFAINWQGKLTKGQILTIRSSTAAATYAGGSELTDHWLTILER